MFKSLVKDGLSSEDIFLAVHVLKSDFPKRDVHQLIKDISTYGSIAAAKWKQQRQNAVETGVVL